jgi:tRNA pseudouridine55 synthase
VSTARVERRDVHGVLLLDKPQGLTSQQAVSRVKRLFAARKAGHTGTLDPMATGLLPVGFGEATKFTQFLLDADKGYLAALQLGVTTTTGDAEGEPLEQRPVSVTDEAVRAVLRSFVGARAQTPPMHSALKVDGRPLYAYARAGVTIERQSRNILIESLQLIDFKENILKIRVLCSKGTYIRVLAEEIGAALGCGAHLVALTRESAGGFTLAGAVSCEFLENLPMAERMNRLLPIEAFANGLERIALDPEQARRIVTGQTVRQAGLTSGLYRLYGPENGFLGVGEAEQGALRARRLVRTGLDQENCLSNPSLTG